MSHLNLSGSCFREFLRHESNENLIGLPKDGFLWAFKSRLKIVLRYLVKVSRWCQALTQILLTQLYQWIFLQKPGQIGLSICLFLLKWTQLHRLLILIAFVLTLIVPLLSRHRGFLEAFCRFERFAWNHLLLKCLISLATVFWFSLYLF